MTPEVHKIINSLSCKCLKTNIDKEFLRLWFVDNCDPYKDKELPPAPDELVIELSSRYIYLYETITGSVFPFPDKGKEVTERIKENLKDYLK